MTDTMFFHAMVAKKHKKQEGRNSSSVLTMKIAIKIENLYHKNPS